MDLEWTLARCWAHCITAFQRHILVKRWQLVCSPQQVCSRSKSSLSNFTYLKMKNVVKNYITARHVRLMDLSIAQAQNPRLLLPRIRWLMWLEHVASTVRRVRKRTSAIIKPHLLWLLLAQSQAGCLHTRTKKKFGLAAKHQKQAQEKVPITKTSKPRTCKTHPPSRESTHTRKAQTLLFCVVGCRVPGYIRPQDKMTMDVVKTKKVQQEEEYTIKPQAVTPAIDTSTWPLLLQNYDKRELALFFSMAGQLSDDWAGAMG